MAGADGVARRTVLRGAAALGGLGLVAALPGCSARPFAGTHLRLATGSRTGNYYRLGTALEQVWNDELGISTAVCDTTGSGANLAALSTGEAQVAISQVDSATGELARAGAPENPRAPRALARIYDDVVHVVVPAASTVTTVGGLRGARVSVGADGSGVFLIARRLLTAAGLDVDRDIRPSKLGIDDSAAALRAGEIDAFFWCGGLPTPAVTGLVRAPGITLLDLTDVLERVRASYPVYTPGTVPAGSYGSTAAITTLLVRNFLLVGADMADELAYALVEAMFERQQELTGNPNLDPALALTIDLRRAISTQPVPLHPGAVRYYREAR